jgi:orotidine-5'-phosphate decarboxylase
MYSHDKNIPARERLIFALDVANLEDAQSLISKLGDSVQFYKLGLEVFLSGHYFELMSELKGQGKKIFADLKLFDIPATVAGAVKQLARHEVDFCTVHGNDSMLKAAAEAKGNMKILAVTALTSLDQGDLDDLGFQCDAKTLVLSRARRALAIGCDGVVSSGLEVPALRNDKRCGLSGRWPPDSQRPRPCSSRRIHSGRNSSLTFKLDSRLFVKYFCQKSFDKC